VPSTGLLAVFTFLNLCEELTVVNPDTLTLIKPRLRITCDAEDPFFIGREVIWQSCDWPNSGGGLEGVRETGL